MDRARSAKRRVLSVALLLALVPMATSATQSPLRAARWLPLERQAQALAFEPSECLAPIADDDLARSIAIGRAAFRTPLLLGGQAARAGLSCNSCHRNGRGNPDFLFPGVSGAPGTADVTSSLMSSHRGDGVANPVAIPDLSGAATQLKVSRAIDDPMLAQFIRGLIESEFDGPKPSPLVFDGVVAYVRALAPEHCREPATQPLRLSTYLADARAALQAARYSLAAHDAEATRLMLASARTALGLIDERYADTGLAPARVALRDADRQLAAIQVLLDEDIARVPSQIDAWLAAMPAWVRDLERAEPRSLFR